MKAEKLTLLVAIVLSLSACTSDNFGGKEVKGSGNIISDKRFQSADFQSVQLALPADYKISTAPSSAVAITGDDNIVPLVKTSCENGVLLVQLDDSSGHMNLHPTKTLNIAITAPHVKSVDFTGAGNVEVAGVNEANFALTVSGAGNAYVSGQAKELILSITGASDADLSQLKAADVKASITGAGNAILDAEESLEVSLTGAGSVKVAGHPKKVSKSITGAGSISLID